MSVEPVYRRIGERLRVLREVRGLSQEEVGSLISVTRACISNIEQGRQRIYVHDLIKLAFHFGVRVQMLFAADVRGGR